MNIFTEKQINILRYDKEKKPIISILSGAVRSGKSFLNMFLFLKHVYFFKNQGVKFIICGNTLGSVKKNVLDDMQAILDIDTTLNKFNEFMLFGNKILCFGGSTIADYKAMKGFTAYGALINEATEVHKNSIDQIIKRCSGEGSRIFMDTNPSHPFHELKTMFLDKDGEKMGERERVKVWHFRLEDNTFLSQEYIENLKKSTPSGHWYDRDILGLWVMASGVIYSSFQPARHLVEQIPNSFNQYICGVDWGFDHHGVMLVIGISDGKYYVIEEICEREKTIDFWKQKAEELRQRYAGIIFYCDTARPEYIKEIQGHDAKKEVLEGIGCIAEKFSHDKLFFVKGKVKRLLDEIYSYSWNDKTKDEQPIKENDDCLDALRYAIYTHEKSFIKLLDEVKAFEIRDSFQF